MDGFRLPLGSWVETAVAWLRDNLDALFDVITVVVRFLVDGLTDTLLAVPVPLAIVLFALIGWALRSWQMALGTAVSFTLIVAMDLWVASMQTLSLVLIAALVAVAIAIPLGIWSARNDTVRAILKPVLDFMQTMPGFVYLIPAITFFSIGVVPGVVATVIFALPPGVRLTELGIRGVDAETVEAGNAFGAKPGQILRGIQLPLAMPTIMAGVNQVIMLALSMAVLAGIVGADGLGKLVVQSVSTARLGIGVEAGLAVVIIAVYLDRVTAALGAPREHPTSLTGIAARRRTAAQTSAPAAAPGADPTPDRTKDEASSTTQPARVG